jgi:hypothetical protein
MDPLVLQTGNVYQALASQVNASVAPALLKAVYVIIFNVQPIQTALP